MKKIAFFILIFFSSFFLYSSIEFDQSVPPSLKGVISNAIIKSSEGRFDDDFYVTSFSFDNTTFQNKTLIQFTLDNKEARDDRKENLMLTPADEVLLYEESEEKDEAKRDFPIVVYVLSDSEKTISKSIEKEIERALFYPIGESEESEVYIYEGSYSFKLNGEKYYKGTTFVARDNNRKIRGLFELDLETNDIALLTPFYLKDMLPGIKVEKASSWRWNLESSIDFSLNQFSFSFTSGYTALIYPFIPKIGLYYLNDKNENYIFCSFSLEGNLSLNTLFPKVSFTLIEDGRLGAEATLLLGSSFSGVFKIDSQYSFYYEHRVLPHFSYRLGYALVPGFKDGIFIGLGGDF